MVHKTALFIGLTYIDVSVPTDTVPTGDDKIIAETYDVGIGGNATIAAITNAKLGQKTELITPLSEDFLGQVIKKKYDDYGIKVHARLVAKTSLSVVLPHQSQRAILRCRDTHYLAPYPTPSLEGIGLLHLDAHQPDAALDYAKQCRKKGILTSLDGGGLKDGILELLKHIDVAVMAERFCEQLDKTPEETIEWMVQTYKTPVAAVTMGSNGMIFTINGGELNHLPALKVEKSAIVDTTGAGDIFHGAYVASYLQNSSASWLEHFTYARAASTLSIQRLGTEASIPNAAEIQCLLEQ